MRERAVGGYEPDDVEQRELVELWHLSRGMAPFSVELLSKHGTPRGVRIAWVVDEYMKQHEGKPNVKRKWIYVWCEAALGHLVDRTVTEVDSRGRGGVVAAQQWMSCCTHHATGGPTTVACSDEVWHRRARVRVHGGEVTVGVTRISDVVPRDDLKVCKECKLPRLMHGTPMTNCTAMTSSPRSK
jgi:hypothetical protein